ncbi:putative PLATZ transcription factor family protein [Quillaja saponaria]|uniref:PLATZ transcription factor family protein n=1 Tax=Quillaja saponaria TaxID=32244 RepID=A0AAD7KNS6_QUISA|nr:putative PLATZ transcription factor family protein [Quillaja saponaria]
MGLDRDVKPGRPSQEIKQHNVETIDNKRHRASNKYQKNYMMVPPWLVVMYNTIFFSTCMAHQDVKKNELDHFCIDCLQPLCSNCLFTHNQHKHVKIRRYIYSDVINRQDLCKLFNCAGIQSYHTNKAKVVFLKQRTGYYQQQQKINAKDYKCIICDRNLQDNSLYCSIACKVLALYGDECKKKISSGDDNLIKKKHEDLSYFKDEDEDYLASLPSPKRQKLRRKGVPLRAPLL